MKKAVFLAVILFLVVMTGMVWGTVSTCMGECGGSEDGSAVVNGICSDKEKVETKYWKDGKIKLTESGNSEESAVLCCSSKSFCASRQKLNDKGIYEWGDLNYYCYSPGSIIMNEHNYYCSPKYKQRDNVWVVCNAQTKGELTDDKLYFCDGDSWTNCKAENKIVVSKYVLFNGDETNGNKYPACCEREDNCVATNNECRNKGNHSSAWLCEGVNWLKCTEDINYQIALDNQVICVWEKWHSCKLNDDGSDAVGKKRGNFICSADEKWHGCDTEEGCYSSECKNTPFCHEQRCDKEEENKIIVWTYFLPFGLANKQDEKKPADSQIKCCGESKCVYNNECKDKEEILDVGWGGSEGSSDTEKRQYLCENENNFKVCFNEEVGKYAFGKKYLCQKEREMGLDVYKWKKCDDESCKNPDNYRNLCCKEKKCDPTGNDPTQIIVWSYVLPGEQTEFATAKIPERVGCCAENSCKIGENSDCILSGTLTQVTIEEDTLCENSLLYTCDLERNEKEPYNPAKTFFCNGEKWLKTEFLCNDTKDNTIAEGQGEPDKTDCADITCDKRLGGAKGQLCEYGTETSCYDKFDNDGDGKTDCLDPDCFGNTDNEKGALCAPVEINCSDGFDNDGNEKTDCADPGCWGRFNQGYNLQKCFDSDGGRNTDIRGVTYGISKEKTIPNFYYVFGLTEQPQIKDNGEHFDTYYDWSSKSNIFEGFCNEDGKLDIKTIECENDCEGEINTYNCVNDGDDGKSCGNGCLCVNKKKTEIICNDEIDNDGDMYFEQNPSRARRVDCDDSDCTDDPVCGRIQGSSGYGYSSSPVSARRVDNERLTAITPEPQGYLCEQIESICGDGNDNDGDNLIDCFDPDCNNQVCGGIPPHDLKVCSQLKCQAIPKAGKAGGEIKIEFRTYSYIDFFNDLILVKQSGVCNDICKTQNKVCLFADGGKHSCREQSSKCTCV